MHTKHNAIASYCDNFGGWWYFDRNSTCCALSPTPSPHRERSNASRRFVIEDREMKLVLF